MTVISFFECLGGLVLFSLSPCKFSWLSNIDAIRASRFVLNVSEGCTNSSGKSGSDSTGPIPGEKSIRLGAGETPGGGGGSDGDATDLVMPGPGTTCAAFLEVLSGCQGGGGGICFMIGAPAAAVKKGGAAAGAPNAAGALTETGFGVLAECNLGCWHQIRLGRHHLDLAQGLQSIGPLYPAQLPRCGHIPFSGLL